MAITDIALMRISQIYQFLKRIKKRANLPESFRPMHGLRHVYASMLASSGKVDMCQLQKLLTHKDSRMTQRYAHLRDEALKRASGVVDDILISVITQNKQNNEEKVINIRTMQTRNNTVIY